MQSRLADLAKEALGHFEERNGQWLLRGDSPQWVKDLVYAAHKSGGILPDDYRYKFTVLALEYIAEQPDAGLEPAELTCEIEPDAYNSSLIKWLGSHAIRAGYVDEAVQEFGWPDEGIMTAIRMGQRLEIEEVFDLVADALAEEAQRRATVKA